MSEIRTKTAGDPKQAAPDATTQSRPLPRREPAVDVFESDAAYELVLDAPGLRPEDLEIDVEDRILTIRGSRRTNHPDDARSLIRELQSVEWFRQFRIGDGVDPGAIEADLVDGVLRLRLPKVDRRHRVTIQSS